MRQIFKLQRQMWMIGLSLIICHLSLSPAKAQIGTWRNYLAYTNVQFVQEAGNEVFVQASGGLYQFNKNSHNIYTYDKTNGLSDTGIKFIRWCQAAGRLVVVYDNTNIDLIETDGDVINVSDLYTKSITGGKTVYGVTIYQQYAFLACEFGVVKVNVKSAEISESYKLGFPIHAVAFDATRIYAKNNEKGVYSALLTKNLIDPSNWSKTDDTEAPSFDVDWTDYGKYIETIKTLKPDGPQYNEFFESKFINGKLYTTGGAFLSGLMSKSNPGIIQVYDDNEWTLYPQDVSNTTGFQYLDINCIDVDPTNENHIAASGRCGLYEFLDGKLKAFYYKDNSPLRPAMSNGKELRDIYTLVQGIKFDDNGNLWVLNSQSKEVNLLLLTKDGKWQKMTKSELYNNDNISMHGMRNIMIDSRGLMWFVNHHYETPAVLCYDIEQDKIYKYTSFINQDGIAYNSHNYPYDIAEDKSGNMWVTTEFGPFMIQKEEIGQSSVTFYQVKVPRNDGTDYADYLLVDIPTQCIAIDGAGRKWFGTGNNGAFLISEDNMTQIHHFTTENSKLISNNILDITINPDNGEVFFLTDQGLCSYVSDATEPSEEMTKDNVWAYPNPVGPDYTGLISVVGLTIDADVKILAPNGALIYEGRSNGGTFTWNRCDKEGRRVASGIYMVATATKNGEKGTVCKIAIIN